MVFDDVELFSRESSISYALKVDDVVDEKIEKEDGSCWGLRRTGCSARKK